MKKNLVILANSDKHSGRCIAGREIFEVSEQCRFGGWIRPVSPTGPLGFFDRRLTNGDDPQLLDIVKVRLLKHEPKPGQPENYLIAKDYEWRKVGRIKPKQLRGLVEKPSSLWVMSEINLDYVTAESIVKEPPSQSLYLYTGS